MSDILIKGMEMPERCWDCDLCYDSFYCKGLEVQFSDREDFEPSERRLSDCPLVPVPPHGRLIEEQWLKDAMITTLEALKKNPKMDRQEMHLIAAFYTLRAMVEDAPTIIEAEEGE